MLEIFFSPSAEITLESWSRIKKELTILDEDFFSLSGAPIRKLECVSQIADMSGDSLRPSPLSSVSTLRITQ